MTTFNPNHSHLDVRLPPERFFFAILDPSSLPRAGRAARRDQLGFLFESQLPIPLESLHAVYERLDGDRALACGMDREVLAAEAGDAVTLGPSALPDWTTTGTTGFDTGRINLLTGPFEPAGLVGARRRWVSQCAAVLLVCSAMLSIGMHRRVVAEGRERRQADTLTEQAYLESLGPSAPGQPPAARLTAELRRLRQTRSPEASLTQPADAAPLLSEALSRWPAELHAQAEQVTAGDRTVRLVVRLPDAAAAETLTESLVANRAWRTAGEQSVERTPEGVRARFTIERIGDPDS